MGSRPSALAADLEGPLRQLGSIKSFTAMCVSLHLCPHQQRWIIQTQAMRQQEAVPLARTASTPCAG